MENKKISMSKMMTNIVILEILIQRVARNVKNKMDMSAFHLKIQALPLPVNQFVIVSQLYNRKMMQNTVSSLNPPMDVSTVNKLRTGSVMIQMAMELKINVNLTVEMERK